MKTNHKRNGIRFAVLLFWAALLGLAFAAFSVGGNSLRLGWATWLFYVAFGIPVLYIGYFASKKLWSIA